MPSTPVSISAHAMTEALPFGSTQARIVDSAMLSTHSRAGRSGIEKKCFSRAFTRSAGAAVRGEASRAPCRPYCRAEFQKSSCSFLFLTKAASRRRAASREPTAALTIDGDVAADLDGGHWLDPDQQSRCGGAAPDPTWAFTPPCDLRRTQQRLDASR